MRFRRGARDVALHRHELRRHGRQPRNARARARPLDALVPYVAIPAADLQPLLDLRRRGRVELPSGAASRHLLGAVADRALQLAMLDEAMANFHRYFFIMPTLARLERELHERVERGEGLTADLLGERTADLSPRDSALTSSSIATRWDHVGAVHAPLRAVLRLPVRDRNLGGACSAGGRARGPSGAARDGISHFLSAGDSVYPLDGLRLAGVDLQAPGAGRGGLSRPGVPGRSHRAARLARSAVRHVGHWLGATESL